MSTNFIIVFYAREGSSSIIEKLASNPAITVPLFEDLDWYLLKDLPEDNVAPLVDRIFKSGDFHLSRDIGNSLPSGPFLEFENSVSSIGFKWRIWGSPSELSRVLSENEVVVFHLVRDDIFSYAASSYISSVVIPNSEMGKRIGIQPGEHPQFAVSMLADAERKEFQKWYSSLRFNVEIDRFNEIALEYISRKEFVEEKYISTFRKSGIECHTLSYEEFLSDPNRFLINFCRIIGVEYVPNSSEVFKKVASGNVNNQIENIKEIISDPTFSSMKSHYTEFCKSIRSADLELRPELPLSGVRRTHLTCPYSNLPKSSYWSKSVALVPFEEIDLLDGAPFQIRPDTKIATAGSCFAQNISDYLRKSGYNYYVTEQGPYFIEKYSPGVLRRNNYGVYSARFGNIYTARQLVQLFDRAYGSFIPLDDHWQDRGRYYDPFRPQIQPNGFESIEELQADRQAHLRHVREMFERLDIFVFTLGLTEAYISRVDGAVYPVCPGCGAGKYDAEQHVFKNFSFEEVSSDLKQFIDRLSSVNKDARIILTVSPVPLVATAENRHVLQSTVYSKSVLRAAAGAVSDAHESVAYFPSYDLITSSPSNGRYYREDLRSVTEEGVAHVMRMFFRHFCNVEIDASLNRGNISLSSRANSSPVDHPDISERLAVVCEEEQLDQSLLPRDR